MVCQSSRKDFCISLSATLVSSLMAVHFLLYQTPQNRAFLLKSNCSGQQAENRAAHSNSLKGWKVSGTLHV